MAALIPYTLSCVCVWAKVSGTEGCEQFWSNCKKLPHYTCIARPVYKLVASHTNIVIATAASFFATDLIMHQLLPQAIECSLNKFSDCEVSWNPGLSLAWVSIALPVMYAKYKRINSKI